MDGLRSLLRDASAVQARQYFGGENVQLADVPGDFHLGQVLKRYMALVILNSEEIQIVFKIHFNPEQVRSYRKSMNHPERDLADRQLVDFMKELTNQMGGRVCRVFDTHQIAMGMSVPLCTRGLYELYADYKTKTGAVVKFGDLWRLDGAIGSLYCSSYVELTSKKDFSQISCPDEQDDEGELDFL